MAQWGNNDQANNSPQWGPALVKTKANTANRDALFGNTTPDAFITDRTDGVFGVDGGEVTAGDGAVAHTGWVLRTVGSGGRAGRVMTEVLVAGGITGDAEDAAFPDYAIIITAQPQDDASATGSPVTFTVAAATQPAGGSLTYLWQENTGGGFANLADAGVYSNTTTTTLSISDNTGLDTYLYRCVVSVTGGDSVNSASALLTETV